MDCICRDDLYAGECPKTCLVRWTVENREEPPMPRD